MGDPQCFGGPESRNWDLDRVKRIVKLLAWVTAPGLQPATGGGKWGLGAVGEDLWRKGKHARSGLCP